MVRHLASNLDRLVGQRIQQKRRELGYTAEKLSEYVDISQPQLSRYERGTNKINVAHLVNIATFLKTPISYFFADCMSNEDWNSDQLDRYWQELTYKQKGLLVEFLKAVKPIA